jgi:acetyl-coenzyme A synthetase (EC 6.2.1.1)
MRRVLSAIPNKFDIGDITTLANPEAVEKIRLLVQGEAPVITRKRPEDLEHFGEER